jgi:hypothetical protein
MKILNIFTAVACAAIATTGHASIGDAYRHLYTDPSAQTEFMKNLITETFEDQGPAVVARAIAVAACESSGTSTGDIVHWDSEGNLLPNNEGGQARASFQVMSELHRPDYESRDIDLDNVYQYMRFVRHLYNRNGGFKDWYPSKHCWA